MLVECCWHVGREILYTERSQSRPDFIFFNIIQKYNIEIKNLSAV